MIVTTISATIRYSQDTGHGAWKVVELGAEASVSDREHWKMAQSELYHQLSHQLRQLAEGRAVEPLGFFPLLAVGLY